MLLKREFLPIIPGQGWYICHGGNIVPVIAFAATADTFEIGYKAELIGFLEDGTTVRATTENPFFREPEVYRP